MSIEKGLYAAPQGIMEDQPDLEIEIEDPELVTLRTDGLEIEIDPDGEEDEFEEVDEDLKESFHIQKNKISEMLNRMSRYN